MSAKNASKPSRYVPPSTVRAGNRIAVYLDPPDREALEAISQSTGAPLAELCRRAVQDWLKRHKS